MAKQTLAEKRLEKKQLKQYEKEHRRNMRRRKEESDEKKIYWKIYNIMRRFDCYWNAGWKWFF